VEEHVVAVVLSHITWHDVERKKPGEYPEMESEDSIEILRANNASCLITPTTQLGFHHPNENVLGCYESGTHNCTFSHPSPAKKSRYVVTPQQQQLEHRSCISIRDVLLHFPIVLHLIRCSGGGGERSW
jgi:hypothetical protein